MDSCSANQVQSRQDVSVVCDDDRIREPCASRAVWEEPPRLPWAGMQDRMALRQTIESDERNDDVVVFPGHPEIEQASTQLLFFKIADQAGGKNVVFDVGQGNWRTKDVDPRKRQILPSPSSSTVPFGTLPLATPQPLSETFPRARPIPKHAFGFWVGGALSKAYLLTFLENALRLGRQGFAVTLVMDVAPEVLEAVRSLVCLSQTAADPCVTVRCEAWDNGLTSIATVIDPDDDATLAAQRQTDALSDECLAASIRDYTFLADLGMYAAAADLARYIVMYQYGGLYIDMGDKLAIDFDASAVMADSHTLWMRTGVGTARQRARLLAERNVMANTDLLAAQPGSPVLAAALKLSHARFVNGGYEAFKRIARHRAGLVPSLGAAAGQANAAAKASDDALRKQAASEREDTIFSHTGPTLLMDAVRQEAPGFFGYLRNIQNTILAVRKVAAADAYEGRVNRVMSPLSLAQAPGETGGSWLKTPTPRRRGQAPSATPASGNVPEPLRLSWIPIDHTIRLLPLSEAPTRREIGIRVPFNDNVHVKPHPLCFIALDRRRGDAWLSVLPSGEGFAASWSKRPDATDEDRERAPAAETQSDFGTLVLPRSRPLDTLFPEATLIPKTAVSFWVGDKVPDIYLENLARNAALLEKQGYTVMLVMDADSKACKKMEKKLHGSAMANGGATPQAVRCLSWTSQLEGAEALPASQRAAMLASVSDYEKLLALGFSDAATMVAKYMLMLMHGGMFIEPDFSLPASFDAELMADSHMVWASFNTFKREFRILAAQRHSPIFEEALTLSRTRLEKEGYDVLTDIAADDAATYAEQVARGADTKAANAAVGTSGYEKATILGKTIGLNVLIDAIDARAPEFAAYRTTVEDHLREFGRISVSDAYPSHVRRTMLPLSGPLADRHQESVDAMGAWFAHHHAFRCRRAANLGKSASSSWFSRWRK
jgi:hypothetical protein